MDLAQRLANMGWKELARIVDLPAEQIDPALAAYWEQCLQSMEPEMMMALVSFWTSRQVLARLACTCARLVAGDDTVATQVLDVTERWIAGDGPIEDVWLAKQTATLRSEE